MTSAVPYEPDDFDNNPFAESSMIIQPPAQNPADQQQPQRQSTLSPHPFVQTGAVPSMSGNQQQDEEQNQDEDEEQEQEQPPPTPDKQVSNNASATENQPPAKSQGDDLDSPFHHYPTDFDCKTYLPERLNKQSFNISVKVIDIEKNGNAGFKNPIIKFNANINNIPGFRRSTYKDVRRTFKEVEAFYKYLIFNNIEVFVPAVPDIPLLYNSGSPEFIESFNKSMQNWFDRVCLNPILIRNQEFVLFFEQNDFSYTPSKTKPSPNSVMATGLRRKTLKQFQPPFDASIELAEFRPMIKSIFIQSQKLLERLEKLLRLQKQSSAASLEVYSKLSELGVLETEKDMIRMWNKFFKVMKIFDEIDLFKSVSINASLTENFKLISDDCYNIKESLTNRHLLMRELVNAEEATKKRYSTINKLKVKPMIDPIKVDEAVRNLELASNYEKELKYQVKRTTYEMLIESQEYLDYITKSIKKVLKYITKSQIQQERKKLHLLASNKLINPMDSLSRLGRDNLPSNMNPVSPSKEDSWTSRPRKSFEHGIKSDHIDAFVAGASAANTPPLEHDSSNEDDAVGVRVDAKSAASLLAGSSF